MRLPVLFVLLACTLALRCGSAIDEPIDNVTGCQMLRVALHEKCSQGELKWLNCGQLPGCTNGSVSRTDVAACIDQIDHTTACAEVHNLECKMSKLDCSDGSAALETACANIAAALELKDCQGFSCGDYVTCDAAAVSLTGVSECFKTVVATASCDDARAAAKACDVTICPKE